MADFRLCLTCKSYSQASLYHYALQLISVQFELTFARFRYSLGSDRPSQTTHLTLFLIYKEIKLEKWQKKGGISRLLLKQRRFFQTKVAVTAPTYPTHFLSFFNSKLQ